MSDGNPIAGLKDTHFDLTRKASVVVRALELALAGHEPRDIAQTPGAGGGHTTAVLTAHGWPSVKAMHANLTALKPLGDLPVTFDIDPTAPKGPAMTTQPARREVSPIERLLDAAARHDRPAITRKGAHIQTLIDELSAAIHADREDAKRRVKIAQLEAELAALKGSRLTRGEYPCDTCDRIFDTRQGVNLHQRRAHEGYDPNAARTAS